jgi:hypothetical protein
MPFGKDIAERILASWNRNHRMNESWIDSGPKSVTSKGGQRERDWLFEKVMPFPPLCFRAATMMMVPTILLLPCMGL